MRTYSYYYIPYQIRSSDIPPTEGSTPNEGKIFIGIRLSDTFLQDPNVYTKLGYYKEKDIDYLFEDPFQRPSMWVLHQHSDAARLAVIQDYKITLIPQTPDVILPPYNDRYITIITASAEFSQREIGPLLYTLIFPLRDKSRTYNYIVEPGSIKEVRSKKSSPMIPN